MKIFYASLFFIIAFVATVLVSGCSSVTQPPSSIRTTIPTSIPPTPSYNPKDYFPMNSGTEWYYKITIGNIKPYSYHVKFWPMIRGGTISYIEMSSFYTAQQGKAYELVMKITGPAVKQGPFHTINGVEIETLKDDLGIFNPHNGIFWSPSKNDPFMINQVVTYSSGPIPYGSPPQPDGYSERVIFFADKPGIAINSDGDYDALIFEGIDNSVAECKESGCLKFIRQVKANRLKPDGTSSSLEIAFTEDTLFAKGKGLVYLEQKMDGQTSMIWTLEKFVSG